MPINSVVLDTNALVGSGWPRPNARLQSLLRLCSELGVVVLVPAAVLLELSGRFRREYNDARAAAHGALKDVQRQLGRVGLDADAQALTSVETADRAYAERAAALLIEYRIDTIPVADVRVADLVLAAAARESPFNEKGEGFRDAIILLSIEAAPPARDAILITADADFGSQDAKRRLEHVGIAVVPTIDKAIDALQERLGQRRQEELARGREHAQLALEGVRNQIEAEVSKLQIRASDLMPQTGVTVSGISAVTLGDFRRLDVSAGEGRTVVITATAGLTVRYFGYKAEQADQPLPLRTDNGLLEQLLLERLLVPSWGVNTAGSPVVADSPRGVQIEATAERADDGGLSNVVINRVRLLGLVDQIMDMLEQPVGVQLPDVHRRAGG